MKRVLLIPVVFAALVMSSCGGSNVDEAGKVAQADSAAVTYTIDSAGSLVEWTAKKVTGQHNGTVAVKSGMIQAAAGKVAAGKFVLNMNSIVVLDMPATDEFNAKLLGHLKSDDFFAVEKNPEAQFEIVKVEAATDAASGNNSTVTGNLTIKGISKSITFPANIAIEPAQLTAKAEFNIDRTEWDIKYGSGKFFQDLGDKMINDEFTVKFNLLAKAAAK